MAVLTGLFRRGSAYYLRVVLPNDHPLKSDYRNGCCVVSLGACSHREAIVRGTIKRAEILGGSAVVGLAAGHTTIGPSLRDVYLKWKEAKPRSADTLEACQRSLKLFEEAIGTTPIGKLSREQGDTFRAWLQHPDRKTTSKTARDRLTWVKSLLKYASRDLELIDRNPWEGLDIEFKTTSKRRPWTDDELTTFFSQPLHREFELPHDRKAGAAAAYWIPLLGLFTGARVGELAQLMTADVETMGGVAVLSVTDEGESQTVKTQAGIRKVPIHSELIRLGFLTYVERLRETKTLALWPELPTRDGKPGGYFSHWFGEYRRSLGFGQYPDFHCLRHTVRSLLAEAGQSEQVMDMLLGHEVKGSTGAKVYTHRSVTGLAVAVQSLHYQPIAMLEKSPFWESKLK